MLLYVSLSSLGPFAMYCVGYLRCQCGEGMVEGIKRVCVCVREEERDLQRVSDRVKKQPGETEAM